MKLYRTAYVDSMCRWYRDLPIEVKKGTSIKLIANHVERHTDSFMKVGKLLYFLVSYHLANSMSQVAKQCEAWQAERDPGNVRLMARRAEA